MFPFLKISGFFSLSKQCHLSKFKWFKTNVIFSGARQQLLSADDRVHPHQAYPRTFLREKTCYNARPRHKESRWPVRSQLLLIHKALTLVRVQYSQTWVNLQPVDNNLAASIPKKYVLNILKHPLNNIWTTSTLFAHRGLSILYW